MSALESNEKPVDDRLPGFTSPAPAPGSNSSLCAVCGQPLTRQGLALGCLRCSVELALSREISEEPALSAISVSHDSRTNRSATTKPICYGHFEVALGPDGLPMELGSGAMATTYQATDTILHSAVALKVINRNVADHPSARARFLREARAAAKLHHPNVANVFHYGEQDGECYYVMELIEGQTLAERINKKGVLAPHQALKVGVQVARALAAAEACGLVHRDLKPANLMLTKPQTDEGDGSMGTNINQGERLHVKVIDWGLAKAITAEDRLGPEQTGDGFVGTPAFASPEQFSCALDRRLDTRSDIYSLGVTLWYALCGRTPFVGDTLETIHLRQQNLPVEQLIAGDVPNYLIDLLKVMVAFDPSARPQSARELLDLFRGCQDRYISTGGLSAQRGHRSRQPSRKESQKLRTVVGPRFDLSPYVFEELRKDEEFIFYRGRKQDDSAQAALASRSRVLALAPTKEEPGPQSLKRLEHEYSLKEELDPAWSARPIAITTHWNRPVLVLEDPGGTPLETGCGRIAPAAAEGYGREGNPWDLTFCLRVAINLAAAIGQLHRRGWIHKDIKPANVLVDAGAGNVWLTGFGITSRLQRDRQPRDDPEFITGTLAYMAPEQTGRMNRSTDFRSDLYSYGVTLYEMLTGVLPFAAADAAGWVYCHVARRATPPDERIGGIPGPVSAIVMRLLAKTAEERYQTAAGVEMDLKRCFEEWTSVRRIERFPLGMYDSSDRLIIPEKLYGRDRESKVLIDAFDHVAATGRPTLVLVSGYSGIGKSAIVNQLHKLLVPPRGPARNASAAADAGGLFASGKFDQYKRDVPYATLAQAFYGLIRPLLSKSETDLQIWRQAFREALGPNGMLMVDLVPELRLIIGEQPPVRDLPRQDAQRRFQLVFRRFIGVFARPEHPLALFLDDLQWLDAATLDLIEDLLTQPDVHHLMLIGAYRDSEVDSSHPLLRKIEAIRQAGTIVREIALLPLAHKDLGQLIADSLHCDPELVASLAQLVHEKTAGNPFFAIQFIYALAEEALFTFDHGAARWSWDLQRIAAKGYTDNVVELMLSKLNRLPINAREALQELACLGNSAEIATLAIVHGTSEEEVESDLRDAIRLQLIERLERSYKFVHDRVQEAAYSVIPEPLRPAIHLQIGRLLWAHLAPEKREEAVFEIVNQLNRGAALITSLDEREHVADLNLIAAERAKISTAYASALGYLAAGRRLLAEDSWEQRYRLTFALELQRAECEFLTGDFAAAEQRLTMLSGRVLELVDRAAVTRLCAELYTTLNQTDRAVEVCLEYLRYVRIEWSPHPSKDDVDREYSKLWRQLGGRLIEQLVDLPPLSDLGCRATLDVLSALAWPAWHTDENLHDLVGVHMANLSLEHGNSDGSCHAYALLGTILGSNLGQYEEGFRFGKLAVDLIEKSGLHRFEAHVCSAFGHHITPWARHLRDGRVWNRRASDVAKESGDLTNAAFSCSNMIANLLAGGEPLEEVQREAEDGLEFTRKMRFDLVSDYIVAALRLIRTLRGLTPKFGSFDDAEFDESQFERHLEENHRLALAACRYWIRKLQARFYADDYSSAIAAAAKAHRFHRRQSFFEIAEYPFFSALAHAAALCGSASAEERARHLEVVATHCQQLKIWKENCPENFGSCTALVAAEIARIEGRDLDAMQLYEEAIQSARRNRFIQNEAIAHEVAGRFYAARGFETIAQTYIKNARYCYLRWGAMGKVRKIDQDYPLPREERTIYSTARIETNVEQLDLRTVMKVSQAVSGEIVLERLVQTLMVIAVEHAGAERGLLILLHGKEHRIAAEARTGRDEVQVQLRHELVTPSELPDSLLRHVIGTQESVILDDASVSNRFSEDEYFRRQRPRSILCLALVKQAKPIGVLYLENNLAPGVFTTKGLAMLELLTSQAAVSLDHARLYADLVQENKDRRKAEESLREAQNQLAHVSRVTTMGAMTASIAHEVNQPLAGILTNASAGLRWLAGESPSVDEARESIRRIIRDGSRAIDVINRMRALFKKAPAAKQPVDINELIQEVLSITQREILKNRVSVQTQLASDLPVAMGDRIQLQQVILNLVLNAIEAMSGVDDGLRELHLSSQTVTEIPHEPGKEMIESDAFAEPASASILIAVRDSGPGLDPTASKQVFETFYTTKSQGMGMGLAISRSIIETHQGRLWVMANPPRGAIFQFTLPLSNSRSSL
jgi:predicted ATPase/serine/threonine protein kinase/signal transduction histidine kinase